MAARPAWREGRPARAASRDGRRWVTRELHYKKQTDESPALAELWHSHRSGRTEGTHLASLTQAARAGRASPPAGRARRRGTSSAGLPRRQQKLKQHLQPQQMFRSRKPLLWRRCSSSRPSNEAARPSRFPARARERQRDEMRAAAGGGGAPRSCTGEKGEMWRGARLWRRGPTPCRRRPPRHYLDCPPVQLSVGAASLPAPTERRQDGALTGQATRPQKMTTASRRGPLASSSEGAVRPAQGSAASPPRSPSPSRDGARGRRSAPRTGDAA